MRTPPTRADYERIARKSKGPKHFTAYVIGYYFDGKFNSMGEYVMSRDLALEMAKSFTSASIHSPWSAKARKVTIKWPERKGVSV